MKRFASISAVTLCLLFADPSCSFAFNDTWTKVRSKNFLLVGNASERDIQQVAKRLEQFREVCSRLLSKDHFDSSTPMTMIVFRDEGAYAPFKPLYREQPAPAGTAGHFQPSTEGDYIAFFIAHGLGRSTLEVALHEYVHLLVKNSFRDAPLWFKEGLAEYYSTFDLTNPKLITFGRPITNRMFALRKSELLPLKTLFEVDYYSPYYTEPDKRGIFYAESWALIHYLLTGRGGLRRAQLSHYLQLLAAGVSAEDSFRQAFHTNYTTLEDELREYITLSRYQKQTVSFDERLEFNLDMQSTSITEAEAQAYLGDLLLHADRLDAAEGYLQRAATLDPSLIMAQISLGRLRLGQNRFSEAKQHLKRAIAIDGQNHLAHYYYADVLSREGTDEDNSVKGYVDKTSVLRSELRKAIEIAPSFLEAYGLLATVELERGTRLDEAAELLKRARALEPKRQDFALLLAQVYVRKEEYGPARELLGKLVQSNTGSRLRAEAQALLDTIANREEEAARHKARNDGTLSEFAWKPETLPCDLPQAGPQLKKLRFDGKQTCGLLAGIECQDTGVVLLVETAGRTLKLQADALSRIRFVSYTKDVKGRVECGAQHRAVPVLVTYRAPQNAQANVDGEVFAVEFVPPEWTH